MDINKTGINPVEILSIFLNEGKSITNDNFAGYWNYRYNSDPKKLLKKVVEKEYLRESTSFEYLDYLGVIELKNILRDNKLKVSGKKDELIERIKDNVENSYLENLNFEKVYVLTKEGKKITEKFDYVKFYHKFSDINEVSLDEYHKYMIENPSKNKYEGFVDLLIKVLDIQLENKDYGLLRNTYGKIGDLYSLWDHKEEALKTYLKVCYFDLSGMRNEGHYSKWNVHLLPHYLEKISEILEKSDLNLYKTYLGILEELPIKNKIFSSEEVFNYIKRGIEQPETDIEKEIGYLLGLEEEYEDSLEIGNEEYNYETEVKNVIINKEKNERQNLWTIPIIIILLLVIIILSVKQ